MPQPSVGVWLFRENPAGAQAQLARLAAEPRLGSVLFSWDALRENPELRAALASARLEARAAPNK